MSLPESLFYRRLPPTVAAADAEHQVVETSTSNAAAAAWDWTSSPAPKGKVWVMVQALTNDAYIRFRSDNVGDTTTANGWRLTAGGDPQAFYVDPVNHKYIDHISTTGAGKLRLYVCSPMGERRDI